MHLFFYFIHPSPGILTCTAPGGNGGEGEGKVINYGRQGEGERSRGEVASLRGTASFNLPLYVGALLDVILFCDCIP